MNQERRIIERDLEPIKEIRICGGCLKKGKSHQECYTKFCTFCNVFFISKEKLKEHAFIYHKNSWCSKCEQIFINLERHLYYQND